jgi:hypothetical protein
MLVFTLSDAILFGCVWASDTVLNSLTSDEPREATILVAPVRLEGTNVSVKKQLDMLLKRMKNFLHVRFALKKVDLGKPAKIIQEANIVLKTTNRRDCRSPHIRMHEFKRGGSDMSGIIKRLLVNLNMLARITYK